MIEKYFLIGYSGHSYVVLDSCLRNNILITGYFESNECTKNPYNLVYMGIEEEYTLNTSENIIIGIGSNKIRKSTFQKLALSESKFTTVIDPSAIVSNKIEIGVGSFVGPKAVINSQTNIKKGSIINTGAIVEHECQIDSFVHIAPGATLCGNVKIGKETLIGANSTILPGIEIGSNCIIGAGSVITKNIQNDTITYGNL